MTGLIGPLPSGSSSVSQPLFDLFFGEATVG
jgi:hypothetical protein